MRLWNEYEGTTIASTFPIEKLIRPEGRSAFFSTVNGSGQPAVIRLIEAHFDEAEILARWQLVTSLDQPHLLKLKKFGRTDMDGEPLLYVVIESSDADLAGILRERPLTLAETQQIATSLVPALQALHRANLVHEHVEPMNILATGEEIKLRSDCIRETPEEPEGSALKAKDVRDLATVLLQCLTQHRTLEAHGPAPLPQPFDQIVRNGIAGTWGLDQIAGTLAIRPQKLPGSQAAPRQPETLSGAPPAPRPSSLSQAAAASETPGRPYIASGNLSSRRAPLPLETGPRRKRIIALSALGILLLLVLIGWHATHSSPRQPITTLAQMPAQPPASVSAANSAPAAAVASTPEPASATTGDWRVIAYTYNHREQAQQKADALAHRYASLHPEVFTPTGRGPYLVALGGPMSREQATTFRNKARSLGLPRDTYAQNYSNHRRR